MSSLFYRNAHLAFRFAILTLLAVCAISYRSMLLSSESDRWVRHTHEVLENAQDLLLAVQSVESSYRGFAFTGNEFFLESYYNGASTAQRDLATIRDLTTDNPAQQRRIPVLERLIDRKTQLAEIIIGLRRGKSLDARSDDPQYIEGQRIMDELQSVIGEFKDEELRLLVLRNADAKRRLFQTKIVLILGTGLGVLIAAAAAWSVQRDSSVRELAEKALRESEVQSRTLLDEVQDYAIFMLDPQGTVVSWNAGAERIEGYGSDEIIGKNFSCFFSREDIAQGRSDEVLRITAASGRHEYQAMRIRKDGSQFFASDTILALRDLAGNLRGFYEISRDLSETKEAGAKYRGLLEAAPDAMVIADAQGRILLVNAETERLFGYRREELIGQAVEILVPERYRGKHPGHRRGYTAHPRTRSMGEGLELCGLRKDNTEFPVEISLSPIETPEGVLISSAIRDVTARKTAEKALRASELKFRGILESAPDAMVIADAQGRIALVNAEAERVFGYPRDEMVGQPVEILVPERYRGRHPQHRQGYTAHPRTRSMGEGLELCGLRKDNTEFPVEISLSPLETAEGLYIASAIRDVTARKKAEEALRGAEERLRMTLEAAEVGTWFWNIQRDEINWSEQFRTLFGLASNATLSYRAILEVIHADDRPRIDQSVKNTLELGVPYDMEYRVVRPDSSVHWIAAKGRAHRNPEGVAVGMQGIVMDITERKRAEEALRQSEERFRLIVSNAKDYSIVMLDPDGRVVSWNEGAERIKGYRADEIIGQHFSRFYPTEEVRDGKPALELEEATKNERAEDEGWRVCKDGSRFYASVVLNALRDETGRLQGFVKITRDITARKKSEEQLLKTVGELKRSNDELQQFAYVASHDLQEPLRMVASYTQLLADRYKGRLDSDADEFIAYAVDGSTRMQGLIQDLLTYSRAGSNGNALHEISSESALEDALANLRATIEESGAIVTYDLLPAITSDATQLGQVFQNLVGNAIKYRGAAVPKVHVSASKNSGNEWIFSVRDNGMGIDPQYFERIFVLFQRLHGREEFKGTGIGLAICKKMLERLGGRIWLESQPGEGSTFYFALPGRNGK